jgi:hypothetical protein
MAAAPCDLPGCAARADPAGRSAPSGPAAVAQAAEVATSSAASRRPRVPPRWFVHMAWRAHRALYGLGGSRAVGVRCVNLVALAMNGWGEGHPAWWLNLAAHPDAVVRLARRHPRPVIVLEPRDRDAAREDLAVHTERPKRIRKGGR